MSLYSVLVMGVYFIVGKITYCKDWDVLCKCINSGMDYWTGLLELVFIHFEWFN